MDRNRIDRTIRLLVAASIAATLAVAAPASDEGVEEQVAQLSEMCVETADARAARQAAKPLHDRLGGYEKIHALTVEIVRLHDENPQIKRVLEGVDRDALAKNLSDFVAAGTGGPQKYTGRDMVAAHEHMGLTDADFVSAGDDVVQAMRNLDHGQEEIDEVVCILVSMKDQVVRN
jgi:hemoglobin